MAGCITVTTGWFFKPCSAAAASISRSAPSSHFTLTPLDASSRVLCSTTPAARLTLRPPRAQSFCKAMGQLRDRLRATDSPLLGLQMNDSKAASAKFPKSVAADPSLEPKVHTTRRIIREVLQTPAARSPEGQRLLAGCLSLYNAAKFGMSSRLLPPIRRVKAHVPMG